MQRYWPNTHNGSGSQFPTASNRLPFYNKARANWLILTLVLSGITFHTPFPWIGTGVSIAVFVYACFAKGIFVGPIELILLLLFSICYGIQLFLPSDYLAYYATCGLLCIVGANSLTGHAHFTDRPLQAALAIFIVFDILVLVDPAKGEALFGNPNAAAAIAVTLFTYCIGYYPKLKLWNSLLTSGLFFLAAFGTESRGALAFFGFFVITYVLARFYARVAVFSTIVIVGLAYAWVAGDPIISDVLYSITGQDGYEIFGRDLFAFRKRDELYNYVAIAVGYTWVGIGLGQSPTLLQPFGYDLSPHNTFLRLYAEGGIFLVVATIAWLVRMFLVIRNPILIAALAGVVLRLVFESAIPFGFSSQSFALLLPYLMSDLGPQFYRKRYVKLIK
jgi:hypothetical protein